MKILMTTNSIISLENVRRVERNVTETNHTSYGKKYTVKHFDITIIYCDNSSEHIRCGEGNVGEKTCAEYWLDIFNKLSEG
jgi:hypothetical protein